MIIVKEAMDATETLTVRLWRIRNVIPGWNHPEFGCITSPAHLRELVDQLRAEGPPAMLKEDC